MTNHSEVTVRVVLDGGPADLPAALRTCVVASDADTVKLPWLGGYEHFRRTGAAVAEPAVFTWVARTRIAE